MALMNQWQMALDSASTSANSFGSATRELATFQESLRYQINVLIAAYQNMALQIGEAGLRDAFEATLRTLTMLADGFANLTEATDGWNIKLPLYAAGTYGLVKAMIALRGAITGVKLSFGLIGVGLVALEAIASVFMSSANAAEVNTQSFIDSANEIKKNSDRLEELIQKHDELKPQAENNTEKQKELQTVLQQINDLAPHLIENTGKYGDALTLNKDKANDYIATLKEMSNQQLENAKLANAIELNKVSSDLEEITRKVNGFSAETKSQFESLEQFQKSFGAFTPEGAIENYRKQVQSLVDVQEEATRKNDGTLFLKTSEELRQLSEKFRQFKVLFESSRESLADYSTTLNDQTSLQAQLKGLEEQSKSIEDQINGRMQVNPLVKQTDVLIDEETGEIIENATAWDILNKSITNAAEDMDLLNQAQKELQDEGFLSQKTLESLVEKYHDLITATGLSKDELLNFITAKKQERVEFINEEIAKTTTAIEESKKRIAILKEEMKAYKVFGDLLHADDRVELDKRQREFDERMKAISDAEKNLAYLEYTKGNLLRVPKSSTNKPDKPKKSSKSPEELAKEKREKAFKENMAHFRFLVEIQNWSANEQIAGLERIAKEHKDYLSESVDDERAIKTEIKRIQDDQAKNAIDNIKKQQKEAEDAYEKWLDNTEKVADDVVEAFKDAYRMQKDIAVASIEKQMEAEDKRHESVMESLDAELDKYEEIISAKLKLIDREEDQEDFTKQLSKAQQEQANIKKQIDVLAMDDSIEAKAKREELEKQLADKTEEIEEMKSKRSKELRKQNLQDQLDDYRKDNEAKKNSENDKFEAEKQRLERIKLETIRYWDEMLNNERFFAELRKNVLEGNVNEIQDKLKQFSDDFKKYNQDALFELGLSFQELLNIIDQVNIASGGIGGIDYSTGNKSTVDLMKANSAEWKSASAERRKELEADNQRLGSSIGATYDSASGTWWKDGNRLYHKGGIVGNKSTSRIGQLLDKLHNTRPDEMVTKSLIGELQVPPKNFPNVIGNLRNMISSVTPQSTSSINQNSFSFDKFIHVENMDKDYNVEQLFEQVERKFKGFGFVLD
jgi:hypothetical protein